MVFHQRIITLIRVFFRWCGRRRAVPNYRTPFSQFLEFVGDIENVGEGLEDGADQFQPLLDLLCAQKTVIFPGEGGQTLQQPAAFFLVFFGGRFFRLVFTGGGRGGFCFLG